MADLAIDDVLRGEGFATRDARETARAALHDAGLTRPGKQRIAAEKLDRLRDALVDRVARHCSNPDCIAAIAADDRPTALVDSAHCSICSGSNNRRALRRLVEACREARIRRILVVGGRPPVWTEVEREAGASLQFRFVDGTSNLPTGTDALRDCAWADLLVIWAPTPLPHKVSGLYRSELCAVAHRVTVHRRGIEAMADEVVSHLRRRVA